MSDCVRKRGVGANAGASDDASHLLDIVIRCFARVWIIKSWVGKRCFDMQLQGMPWNIRLRGARVYTT